MAKLLDYARIANDVYEVPNCSTIGGFQPVQTRVHGSGFKGACYISSDELVVAFAGTETSLREVAQDVLADIKLGLGIPTVQASVAGLFYDAVMTHKGDRRHVTVTGHSLGGGLSQSVGFWKTCNFVTFNAPGMMQSILACGLIGTVVGGPLGFVAGMGIGSGIGHALRRRASERGKNYRLPNDPVSLVNTHYGTAPVTISGRAEHTGHGMVTFISCLEISPWGNFQPFGY